MNLIVKNCDGVEDYIQLTKVIYIQNLSENLLSILRITRNDEFGANFQKDYVDIYHMETNEIVFSGIDYEGLKYISFKTSEANAMEITRSKSASETIAPEPKTGKKLEEKENNELLWV